MKNLLLVSLILLAEPAWAFTDCSDCPEMIDIPAGSFLMGSPSNQNACSREKLDDRDDEKPQHTVKIKEFSIGFTIDCIEIIVTPSRSLFIIRHFPFFKRFDFRFFERNTWYQYLLNFRINITTLFLSLFGLKKHWVKNELFDKNNLRYEIDDNHRYEDDVLKYFYKESKFVYNKETENQDQTLEKFN